MDNIERIAGTYWKNNCNSTSGPEEASILTVFTIADEKHNGLLNITDIPITSDNSVFDLSPVPECYKLKPVALNEIQQRLHLVNGAIQVLHTELAIYRDVTDQYGKKHTIVLSAHDIHQALESNGIPKKKHVESIDGEWFSVDLLTIQETIDLVKKCWYYADDEALLRSDRQFKIIETRNLVGFDGYPLELFRGKRFENLRREVLGFTFDENGIFRLGSPEDAKINYPIVVRPKGKESYEIVHGHYRVAVAQELQIKTIPCVVLTNMSDDEALNYLSTLNPVGLLKKCQIDIRNKNFRNTPEYRRLKGEMVLAHDEDITMCMERYILRFLLEDDQIPQLFDSIYCMGNTHKLTEKECRDESIAQEIILLRNPDRRKELEDNNSDKVILGLANSALNDEAKELANNVFLRNDGGIISGLRENFRFDLEKFDYTSLASRQQRAKLLFFLYNFKDKYFSDNPEECNGQTTCENCKLKNKGKCHTVYIMHLLRTPSMENIDRSAWGWKTRNGEIFRFLKQEVELELSDTELRCIRGKVKEVVNSFGEIINKVTTEIETMMQWNIDCSQQIAALEKNIEAVKGQLTLEVPADTHPASPMEAFYFRLVQNDYLGELRDLRKIYDFQSHKKTPASSKYQTEMRQLEQHELQQEEVEAYFNPDNVQRIAKYVYAKDESEITKEDRRKIRNMKSKALNLLKCFRLADPYDPSYSTVTELFLISCLQYLLYDDSEDTFPYFYPRKKRRISVKAALKGKELPIDALKVYLVRRIMDYSYTNTGESYTKQLMQKYEKIAIDCAIMALEGNTIEDMLNLQKYYLGLLSL